METKFLLCDGRGKTSQEFCDLKSFHNHVKSLEKCEKECKICLKLFPTHSQLIFHKKFSHGNGIQCDQCDVFFTKKSSYDRHIKSNQNEDFVHCLLCKKKVKTNHTEKSCMVQQQKNNQRS